MASPFDRCTARLVSGICGGDTGAINPVLTLFTRLQYSTATAVRGSSPRQCGALLFFFLLSDHSRWPARGLQDGQFYFLLYSSYCQKLCSGLYQLLPSRIGFGSLFPTITEGHVARIIKIYPDLWYTIEARPNGYSPGLRHAAVVRV